MDGLIYLIPAALLLGFLGLMFFIWAIKNNQYDDLDGDAYRALFEEDDMAKELKKKKKTLIKTNYARRR